MVIHLRNGLDCFTFEQKKLVMGRCEIRFFHQFWMVFQPWQKIILDVYKPQPWQKIMNGMLKKYQHRKFIFNWWKEKRISRFRNGPSTSSTGNGVQRSIIPMVPWFYVWESVGIPSWLQLGSIARCNERSGAVICVCDLCDLCVILWRILTLYKTKADKDFSAH